MRKGARTAGPALIQEAYVFMAGGSKTRSKKARQTLGWALACFLLANAGLSLAQRHWLVGLRDPDYGHRLALLRRAIAARPHDPLVLVLGSSRTLLGLSPDVTDGTQTSAGPHALVFNFSLPGAKPLHLQLTLRRLFADGIRPDHVVLEYWPPFFSVPYAQAAPDEVLPSSAAWGDIPCLCRYAASPADVVLGWASGRLCPWYANRFTILTHYARSWTPPDLQARGFTWSALDRFGWLPYAPEAASPEERGRLLKVDWQMYGAVLRDYQFSEAADRALREAIANCQGRGVPATLLFMPEAPELRGWYPENARKRVSRHLGELRSLYGVEVVDARDWYDARYFMDTHHLLKPGTRSFTARFGRDVVPRLLARAPASAVPVAR